MRCNYCLGDDAVYLQHTCRNKDGKLVSIYFHKDCWKKVQLKVLDMIAKGELDFKEEEE